MADQTWNCRACGATYTTEPYCWRCKRPGQPPTRAMQPPHPASPVPTTSDVDVEPTPSLEMEHLSKPGSTTAFEPEAEPEPKE